MDTPNQHDPWQTPPEPQPWQPAHLPGVDSRLIDNLDPQSGPPVRRRPVRVAVAWALIGLSTIVIMAMQLIATQMPAPPPQDTQPSLDTVLVGRIAVGFKQLFGHTDQSMLLSLEEQAKISPFETTDRLRIAIVAGELIGTDSAIDRLGGLSANDLESGLEPTSDFRSDRSLLQRIYGEEAYVPNSTESQDLIQRHGWFGELAAGYNLGQNDPLYASPRNAATAVVWLMMGFGGIIVFAFIAGFGLFITACILGAMGKIKPLFKPGEMPHDSAYIELVAVFLIAFIALQLLAAVLMAFTGLDLLLPVLILTAMTVLWPVVTCVRWNQYRQDMGLIAPQGVAREIGAGIVGYLAGLPIVLVGGIMTVIIALFSGLQSEHPAGQEVLTGGTYQLIVLILAVVVWAPVVEEMVFRAAFYRHMRRVPGVATWLAATLLTSFIFAAIHPQGVVGIPILMSIAIVLACLRQWRGSLVAPITAHAMHNGAIITFTILLLYL